MVANDKLRQALSSPVLAVGGNPLTASAAYAAIHALVSEGGAWWVEGGTGRLVAAMARRFEMLGGTLRLGDAAVRVHLLGNRANEVECASGWRERFDAVASNADVVHTYRTLLGDGTRGRKMARLLARRSFGPGLFAVHFGIEGAWPGIPHHMVLFGPRYEGLLHDVFDHGVLPRDFIIHLHHPSVTDPSVAPAGRSTFSATVPVANLGKLPIDWGRIGPQLERRVLDEIGRRLIPGIHDRVITCFHLTPRDFARELNLWQGSPFSLTPTRRQSGWLRCRNRDEKIVNFYLVGSGTSPGAGVPAVIAGARATANLMLGDLM
jgi:phytoene desaturase